MRVKNILKMMYIQAFIKKKSMSIDDIKIMNTSIICFTMIRKYIKFRNLRKEFIFRKVITNLCRKYVLWKIRIK